jgi:hypothetical protein
MKTQKAIALSVLLLGLSACGKWVQDPFAGKDSRFRNGLPKATPPDFTKPLPSNAVRVLGPKAISYEEGVSTEVQIVGRVFLEDYNVELQFENIADFPGARYDAKTGKLTWAPPRGFVDAAKSGNIKVTKTLNVTAVATKPNAQVLVGTQSIEMNVSRDFLVPEITNIQKTDVFVREGTTSMIQVYVRDRDANPSDVTTYPRIIFQSIAGTKSMASMLNPQRTDNLGNGDYRIYMYVDARDLELTSGVDNYKVGMLAASRYGKLSTIRIFDMDVFTSFATPTATWTDELVTTVDAPTKHQFLIIDPKQEAVLALDRTFNVPVGATLTCLNTNPSTLSCTFSWTPATGTENSVNDIQVYVSSRNKNARDTLRVPKTLTFRTRVQPKGP